MAAAVRLSRIAAWLTRTDQEGSLASNPTVAPIDLTVQGSDWLWAVFAVMFSTGLGVRFLSPLSRG